MKFLKAIILLVCLSFLTFPVCAAKTEYSVTFDKEFTVGYTDGDLSAVAQITEMDKDALKDYCLKNGIVLFAVNADLSAQARLYVYETELSKSAKDLSAINGNSLSAVLEGNENYTCEKYGDTVYLKTADLLDDSGGKYLCTQYLTVKNGKIYQFSIYSEGQTENEKAKNALKTLKIENGQEIHTYGTGKKIIIGAVLTVLAALVVVMIIGIVKDIKNT